MQLKRKCLSATESGWRIEWPGLTSDVYGSRLSVVSAGNVVAEAVLQQVPDHTLSVLFTKPVAESSSKAVDLILADACQTVSALNLAYAYAFLPPKVDAWIHECFQSAGFRVIECILEFRCDRGNFIGERSTALTFWHGAIDSAEAVRPFTQPALDALIANVIEESADLPQLPPPTASQVQLLWQVLNADVQLTIALLNQRPVGIAVFSCSGHPSGETVILEYFGVHSDFRRLGIGRDLLRAAAESIRPQEAGWLTSFVAEGNEAAKDFFSAQRFEQHSSQQLWAWPGLIEKTDLPR